MRYVMSIVPAAEESKSAFVGITSFVLVASLAFRVNRSFLMGAFFL